jgi:predicted ATPase
VTSDQGLRFRAVDAFADLAEELALSGPLVIGLDDLHWADPSSLLTLGTLSRRLADLPFALVGCFRLSPRVPELDQLAGALEEAGARLLTVRPLADDAVAGLVAEIVAAEPSPGLLARISGAAGNPLFVTEPVGGGAGSRGGHRDRRRVGGDGGAHAPAHAAADDLAPPEFPAR